MIVTAWNNGKKLKSGGGFGIKVAIIDRDRYFRREWRTVILELEGEDGTVEINIDKPSFWDGTCRELISARIGKWLIKNKLAPWVRGNPPMLILTQIEGRQFWLTRK